MAFVRHRAVGKAPQRPMPLRCGSCGDHAASFMARGPDSTRRRRPESTFSGPLRIVSVGVGPGKWAAPTSRQKEKPPRGGPSKHRVTVEDQTAESAARPFFALR